MMNKTKISFVVLTLASLISCSSKKAVNDSTSLVILPMVPVGANQVTQDALGRAPSVALQGKLLLQNDIPTPLSNVQIGLYKKQNDKWSEISKFNTEPSGAFGVTQKLASGNYELRILDKRYSGTLALTLDKEPIRDLILYATKK